MRFPTFLPLILVLCTCQRAAPRDAPPPGGTRTHLWVDAAESGPGLGDGSQARPLRSLAEALARPGPLTVHLGPGTYPGPFTLPEGVRLEGNGADSVLAVDGKDAPVLRAGRDAELVKLAVRGGGWGLEVTGGGRVRLERVDFTGQRTGAVRVEAGQLVVESGTFVATVAETTGVLVEGGPLEPESGASGEGASPASGPGPTAAEGAPTASAPGASAEAKVPPEPRALPRPEAPARAPQGSALLPAVAEARITRGTFTGPYRRAVRIRGTRARVELEDVRFSGPVSALGVDSGHAEVRRAVAEGGTGSAFSVVDGTLVLEDVRVTGHEYGLSAMNARRLDVRGFFSEGARRAGLGVVRSTGVLEDVRVKDSGEFGGLQFVGGDMEVRRFEVNGSAEYGLSALSGKLRLRRGSITGVTSGDGAAGDGLHLRQVDADVEAVRVRDVAGACVLAAQDARVVLREADLRGCQRAGVAVDTLAKLEAPSLEVHKSGVALSAMGGGELRVDDLSASDLSEGLAWTECKGATRVRLEHVRAADVRGLSAPCVERPASESGAPR
ncbi:hypothetical protein [Pyxidicoccus trucidator]|uniref:hypothetical protein n=1 Tax=Pyxidicoccus trucidator TaxID=2709662 RepID=UPI001F086331|nr:hypothetical protein [Pyxidicoccus trucidator]